MEILTRVLSGFIVAILAVPILAAPLSPPRKINARSPQLHLLDRDWIPQEEHRPWHPPELVAILGSQRGRHWEHIDDISYSRDGIRIATFSRGSVCVWKAPNLRFQFMLPVQAAFIRFVPQGNSLLTCGKDGVARLWDVSGEKPRSRVVMRGVLGDFSCVAVSPNGAKLVVSTKDGFNFCDLSAKPSKGTYLSLGEEMILLRAAFSPDSRTLITLRAKVDWNLFGVTRDPIMKDHQVTLWDVSGASAKARCSLTGASDQWGSIAFSPDGKTVVSGANIWDLSGDNPKFRGAMNGSQEPVLGCDFYSNQLAITASREDVNLLIRVRDMRQRVPRIVQTVELVDSYWRGLALSPDKKTLAVGEVNCLYMWQMKDGKIIVPQPFHGHRQKVEAISFGACGNLLASIGQDASLRLWDLDGTRPRERLVHQRKWGSWNTVALSPDGTKLATGFLNSGFTLWDVSPAGLRVLAEHKSGGTALAFSPDSKTLFAAGSLDGIEVVDVSKPTEVSAVLRPGQGEEHRSANSLVVSPDGKTLAVGGGGKIELWRRTDVGWMKRTNFQARIFYKVSSMSFGQHGSTLVLGGGIGKRGEVRIFEVGGDVPKHLTDIAGHKAAVTSVSASSNGKFVASTDESGHVIVSSVSGERLHEWTFPGPVRRVAFAPDGQHLALGNGDGTVYILRLAAPSKK